MDGKESNIQALIAAGLTNSEAKAYIDLRFNGESQTGKICTRTNIRSSHIYTILNSLLEKGLVTYKVINNIKVFSASSPENLAHIFEEKEKKIKDEKGKLLASITQLKAIPQHDRLTDFKYFSDIRGVKSMFTEIMNLWNKNDSYYVAAVTLKSFQKLEPFFLEFHKKRIKDKVSLKIIFDRKGKQWGEIRKTMPKTEVKYLDLETFTEYGVLNDYLFLASYGEKPYGLLIKDKNFAETYKTFFEMLWKIAKS
ncbi:hypothetical protein COV18_02255 [Candidatus Woesearchaeota archaeon CG10_big_fil_rev_8_21_14_0_10_37_12]|nr:MAG: hypothetical protein COV18_02255 [Candidatus Woesearchaeota archaeon CG10_big_fil_rev_8_21_14_0_10_37_12]